MARTKKRIQYTVKDYPGSIIEVESPKDDENARNLALEEILRRIDDESDLTFSADSFQDGLSIEDLIFVEPSRSNDKKPSTDRELQPIEVAAKEVAQFSLLRVQLQKNQELAKQYLELIEALFTSNPLTEEQIEIIQRKEFSKALESLASIKVDYDEFLPKAEAAWKILKPIISGTYRELTENSPENNLPSATPKAQSTDNLSPDGGASRKGTNSGANRR